MQKRKLIAMGLCLALMGNVVAGDNSVADQKTEAAQQGEAQQAEVRQGLFVNLTTDDTWAAAKAILFAHQKALKSGKKPVAIWLNVRAIYLIDKKRPSHVHGLMKNKGTSIQDMLTAFMKDGGIVIACGACSKAAGLTKGRYFI